VDVLLLEDRSTEVEFYPPERPASATCVFRSPSGTSLSTPSVTVDTLSRTVSSVNADDQGLVTVTGATGSLVESRYYWHVPATTGAAEDLVRLSELVASNTAAVDDPPPGGFVVGDGLRGARLTATIPLAATATRDVNYRIEWTVTGADLIKHGEELLAAANLALTFDAPTNPSTSACKYCKAKPICPSIRAKVQDNARKEFAETVKLAEKDKTVTVPPVTPDMVELAQLAASWSEAVLDAAKKQITEGSSIQGWTLRPGRKTKFWKSDALAYEALKSFPQAFDLKSPSAIAKLDISISDDLIGEKHAAASLVKEKSKD